ncbi:hypothetical protein BGX33_010056 [Mortierella sp. NVP41]|nr:hypothetical protein BGX33_010056 [Mortierella sp. NVP41]
MDGKTKLELAIDALTLRLENGDYFQQTAPAEFDAKGYFAGIEDQRRAPAKWTTVAVVLPRPLSSSHGELRTIGLALQKMWHSKDYKKEFNKARAQETIVLESVHKHQARILDHSYKDLCHTLQKREESFNGTETSVSANKQSSNIQAKTDALIRGSVAAEALPCSSSVSLLNSLTRSTDIVEGTIDETLESAVDDKTTNVKQMAEEDQELSDTEEGISFAVFTEVDRKVFAETYLKLQHTVTLPSGSRVEDVLFTAGVTKKRHHLIHSLIVDVDDESTKSLFTPTDWDFIKAEQEISLEIKDKDILDVLARFRESDSMGDIMANLNERHPRLGKRYTMDLDYDLKWTFDSVSKWLDLYSMPFPVFTCDSPLEYFWRSQVWGVLDTLFFDISNTLMIGGESPGIESTERRNQ